MEKFAAFSGISGVQPKILVRDENASLTLTNAQPESPRAARVQLTS
jgi:hypothetical protein